MAGANQPHPLLTQARAAEAQFGYRRAYELYLRAADQYDALGGEREADEARFFAARSLLKHETWRASAVAWEAVGNRVASGLEPICKPAPSAPGQDGMYHVISDAEWRNLYPWYYGDAQSAEAKRHRQAFAYMWGAREEVDHHVEHGIRLYRKAALAWEYSSWGAMAPFGSPPAGVAAPVGEKWRLAANCWFLACYHAASSIDPEDREWDRVLDAHEPPLPTGYQRPVALPLGAGSDVERLCRCWRNYGEATSDRSDGLEQACEQLRMLQSAFAREGRKEHAKRLFRLREQMLLENLGGPLPQRARLLARRAWYEATRSNTDLVRISALAILLYLVVFPAVYNIGGLILHHESDAPVSVWDSLVFSLATLVTLSVRDLVVESPWGAWVQTLEALSAYFVLGYVIWVVLRSFEE